MTIVKRKEGNDMGEYNEVFKRTEIKYLLNEKQFERLFPFMETLARVDRYGLSRINNIYYDTPDYRLIRTSLEKPRYKEKLRLRTYGETHNNELSESISFRVVLYLNQ